MELRPITLTIADACHASGLGKTKLYELIKAGLLESTVVGGRRLIRYDSLNKLLSCR